MLWIILTVLAIVLIGMLIFFRVPYSPVRAKYKKVTEERLAEEERLTAAKATQESTASPETSSETSPETKIANLPEPVQRYLRQSGFLSLNPSLNLSFSPSLNRTKTLGMSASLHNADFVMGPERTIKVDYVQLNLANRPERYALITASLFGIPFEGFDAFTGEVGSMKGVLAKIIPLFNQKGENMTKAGLVTWLAECLLVPGAALQDFIAWEAIDQNHAAASITWNGHRASGVFTFAENGDLLGFRTSDRTATDMNGHETQVDWSELYSDYHEVDGLHLPQIIQSVWHYPAGDIIYFNEGKVPASMDFH